MTILCGCNAAGGKGDHRDALLHQLSRLDARRQIGCDSFARFGAETLESTPEEFAKFIREDLAKWQKLVRETGIKLE